MKDRNGRYYNNNYDDYDDRFDDGYSDGYSDRYADQYDDGYSGRYDDRYADSYDSRSDAGYDDFENGFYEDNYEDDRAYNIGRDSDYESAPKRKKSASRTSGRTSKSSTVSSGRKKTSGAVRRSSSSAKGGSRKKRRKKSSGFPVALVVLLIIFLCGAFGFKLFLDRYSYSKEKADLNEYLAVQGEDDVPIIWGNELSDIRAKYYDSNYYMALSDVNSKINNRFYYGVQNDADLTGMIQYALPDKMVTTILGTETVTVGDEQQNKDYTPAIKIDGTVYIALNFVKEYTNFTFTAFEEPRRLQIDTEWPEQTVATVARKTQSRTSGGIKSSVLEELPKGSTVTILDKMENWSKVKSEDSIIGYVENKRLKDETTYTPTAPTDYVEPEYETHMLGEKANIAFHNVYGAQGNVTLTSYMAPTKTVNVIAPTWFWINSNSGTFDSAAEQSYVDTAHGMGLKVWGVVDNFNSTELPSHNEFLATLDSRTNLINGLMREASTYDLDGINVDFELIDADYGRDYIEFIRELSIACRNQGLTLSVDNYVPYNFNDYYDIGEQGIFADYVMIMGYDEHYAGSTEAGSVASIDYVTDGIVTTCSRVPKEKVINILPFYSRIWKTVNGTVTCEQYGMQDIQDYIASHNMTVTWDASTGQNYAETVEGDTLIQIWVEDAQSIREKLNVMAANEIGGVSCWRLEFETPDIWDEIANYMNG